MGGMLRQALEVKPELLLPVVRAAIDSLPHNTQHPHIRLHPQDAVLVREIPAVLEGGSIAAMVRDLSDELAEDAFTTGLAAAVEDWAWALMNFTTCG